MKNKVDREKLKKNAVLFEEVKKELNLTPERKENIKNRSKYYQTLMLLQEARKDANFTQEQLAQKAGIKRVTLSRIENGHRNTTVETLMSIAEALGKRLEIRLV